METERLCPEFRDLRVLVVDDNDTNREILVRQLSSWNITTEEAVDGPLALQSIYRALEKDEPFQAVLLDMQMPGMDGESLARIIKSDRKLKDISLIMLSSLGHQPGYWSQYGSLFEAYLTKPVRPSELYNELCDMFSKQELKRSGKVSRREGVTDGKAEHGIKVLLVEDNIVNQKVAQSMLKKLGFDPGMANNGEEAVKILETAEYDIVLMDVQMPGMDGLETTRHIRGPGSAVLDHELPIIAMTAHAMKGDRENALKQAWMTIYQNPLRCSHSGRSWISGQVLFRKKRMQ